MATMSGTSRKGFRLPWAKDLSPRERKERITRSILLPGLNTFLIMLAIETIKDKPTLFTMIMVISVGFTILSYGIIKFAPLKTNDGKKTFVTTLFYITLSSVLNTLSVTVILTVFLYGHDLPLVTFDYETQVLSFYMQKVYVLVFIYMVSWLIAVAITKKFMH